ncbi:MAG: hypothetical protein IH599_06725 [Bacteroidales bacterium]|nr:hypothetical protein [Bacteroidales bacterium]
MLSLFVLLPKAQEVLILRDMQPISCQVVRLSEDSIWFSMSLDGNKGIVSIARERVLGIMFDQGALPVGKDQPGLSELARQDGNAGKIKDGPANALLSLAFPGLGDYRVRETKFPYWTIGALSYGMMGTGLYLRHRSKENHGEYIDYESYDQDLYRNSNRQHHAYLLLTRGAMAVWATDVILVGLKGSQNVRKRRSSGNSEQQKLSLFIDIQGYPGLVYTF